MTTLVWMRRDLRRRANPALEAAAAAGPVAVALVVDPAMVAEPSPRVRWWAASALAARERLDGALIVRLGDPRRVVPDLAAEVGAARVVVTAEPSPPGARRDARVSHELAGRGIGWHEVGNPYAFAPGSITTGAGAGYRVFTPYSRVWHDRIGEAMASPTDRAPELTLARGADDVGALALLRELAGGGTVPLPPPGEESAWRRWEEFRDEELRDYETGRDRPDRAGTSRLSGYLKVGAIHPRMLLADLARRGISGPGVEKFTTELAWRDFYADVLARDPASARADLTDALAGMRYDLDGDKISAWRAGMTGFPFVDAGMRQLLATGWMHNRVRMVVASFLTKDLHAWWPIGASHFMERLIDADVASNSGGWQWVAGTGTDAAPYFRVFNPVTQGTKFDPDGAYVRAWVPELAHLPGAVAHQPWRHERGYSHGYPRPIVDHADERREALARYAQARAGL